MDKKLWMLMGVCENDEKRVERRTSGLDVLLPILHQLIRSDMINLEILQSILVWCNS